MNKLKSLALIIKEIDEAKLSGFLKRLEEIGLEELKLFTESKPKIKSKIKVELAPLNKGRDILFEKFRTILIEAKESDREISPLEFKIDLDLIIKVGEELESLENTLIPEASYAEIHFAKMKAQDFKLDNLKLAIEDYLNRKRNFGI